MWSQFTAPQLYQTSNRHVRLPVKRTTGQLSLGRGLACLRVSQFFLNKNEEPLECCYSLRLLPEVLLQSISAKIGENTVKFCLKEKEEAKETYSDAIAEGKTVLYMESEESDLLVFRIGMMQPGAELTVTLKLVYPMEFRKDSWRCIVANGFFPQKTMKKKEKRPISEALPLDISIMEAIQSAISPSHSIQSTMNSGSASIQLLPSQKTALDFILEYTPTVSPVSFCAVEMHPQLSEYTAMLVVRSEFVPDAEVRGEYVFILDRSGSMAGTSIKMLREAMVFLLKSLPAECKFNVVSFGSSFEMIFDEPQTYGDESVTHALESVREFEANLGGTDLLPALKAVLSVQTSEKYPRNVILLTDGCVASGDLVLSLLRKHRQATRFHAIGLGGDVSEKWLQAVSELTAGGHEVVKSAKQLSASLVKFLERVLTPCISGLQVQWPEKEAVQANTLRNVYEGDVLFVFANFAATTPRGDVTLSFWNTAEGGRKSITVPMDAPQTGKVITKLWAKGRIGDLQTEDDSAKRSVEVSLKYRVLSPHTAYVAVGDEVETSMLPMASLDSGGMYRGARGAGKGMCAKRRATTSGIVEPYRYRPGSVAIREIASMPLGRCRAKCKERSRSRSRSPPSDSVGSLQWLIEAQSSNGSWSLRSVQVALNSATPPAALKSLPDAENVWATLQVLFLLLTRFQSDSDKTVLIVKKAKQWLAAQGASYADYEEALSRLGY